MSRPLSYLAIGYAVIVVGGSSVVVLLGLLDSLRDHWYAYLARQIGPVLERERSRHAAELAEARRQHKDAQLWLMETHRQEIARVEARSAQRVTEAVVEAMTNCAPHPRLRAS